MPVRISDYLADTLHLGTEQHSAVFHLFPLEILGGDDAVLAWITGHVPNAWKSRAMPADFVAIRAGHWHRGDARQGRSRIAANPQSNPNRARPAASGRWTDTATAKMSCRCLLAFRQYNRYCTMRSRAWRSDIKVSTRVSPINSPRFFRHHLRAGMTLRVTQAHRAVSS